MVAIWIRLNSTKVIAHNWKIEANSRFPTKQKSGLSQNYPQIQDIYSHYNTISAFIKSMRASNSDASLYYLARLVESGEDPLFIARRMVIFASEDIGLAAPTALVVANAVFAACQQIGYPECAINLAHGVAYLSRAAKDRSAYDALRAAQADVKQFGNLPIPLELRNAPTKLMKKLNYGKGYEMYYEKSMLPDQLKGKKYLKGDI
jgi:putative ATPase